MSLRFRSDIEKLIVNREIVISALRKSCTKFRSTKSIGNCIPDRMVMVSEVSGQFHYRFSCIFDENPAVPELDTPSFFLAYQNRHRPLTQKWTYLRAQKELEAVETWKM